jgi:hypothetical protein
MGGGGIKRSTMGDGDKASPFILHFFPESRALVSNNSYHIFTFTNMCEHAG